MASSNKGGRTTPNSRPNAATGTNASKPKTPGAPGQGAKSGTASRPVTAKSATASQPVDAKAKLGQPDAAKSATPSRPVGTKAPASRPVASRTPPASAPNSVVKRAGISPTRQARLEAQRQHRRARQTFNGVVIGLVALVVVIVGFAIYQAIPKPPPAQKACLTVPANMPSTADQPPPTNLKPVKLSDGLEYIDLVVGCGATLATGDSFTANYTGWVQGGHKFQSSRDSGGSPFSATLSAGSLIQGWIEGLPGMKVGGVRCLIIPAALAYGANPQPGSGIPPNANLIFDVSLLSIP
jgi:FKBP-type peptidyl-prolyl cis-trans isomerase FkpA